MLREADPKGAAKAERRQLTLLGGNEGWEEELVQQEPLLEEGKAC